MKTENEVTKVKALEESLSQVVVQINGEDPPPEAMAQIVGLPLAVIDALFAIRDGESWRDLNDPGFIARKALQSLGIGD